MFLPILVLASFVVVSTPNNPPVLLAGDCSYEQFTVVSAVKYRDGGTIRVAVTDSVGCLVEFRYDFRIGSPTQGRMYIGERAEGQEGDRLASWEEESRTLDLVSLVLDSNLSRPRQLRLQDKGCEDWTDVDCRRFALLVQLLKDHGRR